MEPPFAFVDLDAVWANAADMLRRAGGIPIRVASKSVRCRAVLERVLSLDRGFQGCSPSPCPRRSFSGRRASGTCVLAYPCVDPQWLEALARLTAAEPEAAPVAMVDSVAHLDLIEAAAGPPGPRRRCGSAIDIDAGLRLLGGAVAIGPEALARRTRSSRPTASPARSTAGPASASSA